MNSLMFLIGVGAGRVSWGAVGKTAIVGSQGRATTSSPRSPSTMPSRGTRTGWARTRMTCAAVMPRKGTAGVFAARMFMAFLREKPQPMRPPEGDVGPTLHAGAGGV